MLVNLAPVTIHSVGIGLSVLGLILQSLSLSLGLGLAYQRLGLDNICRESRSTHKLHVVMFLTLIQLVAYS